MSDIIRTIDYGERGTVQVVADGEALARTAASLLSDTATNAANDGRHALVALSGGSTPKLMGQLLAQAPFLNDVAWPNLEIFWGDERWVPLADGDSNAGEAKRGFLDIVPIPDDQVHPFDTEGSTPEESAATMQAQVVALGGSDLPAFDLVLLGMGDDGHTASLFPGTAAIHEANALVVSHFVPKLDTTRLTFTPPLINAARTVAFLAGGAGKADMLHTVLDGPIDVDTYPSQVVRPGSGSLIWIVDEAAAAKLDRNPANG